LGQKKPFKEGLLTAFLKGFYEGGFIDYKKNIYEVARRNSSIK
jgi:hypothetical protein